MTQRPAIPTAGSALDRTSLREQAKQRLRASIISGEIAAGKLHSAVVLGEQLGVSATPIREAMLDLASLGLVEAVRNRGFRVVTLSEKDLDDIVEVRFMLEVPAMRRVVARVTDAQLDELEPLLGEFEVAAKDGRVAGFLEIDRRFHLGLLDIAGNQRLVDLVARLRDQTRLRALHELPRERLMAMAADHRAIVDAIRDRDAQAAEDLMRAHLAHARGDWAGLPHDGVVVSLAAAGRLDDS